MTMKSSSGLVYQLKITLLDVTPSIWRRIQAPESSSFWDLHVAIQDAMGWNDSHLHQFTVQQKGAHHPLLFGIPMDEDSFEEPHLRTKPGWEFEVSNYLTLDNHTAGYQYDFGDNWRHSVELEGILRAEADTEYPICVAGERASPPDDCGGTQGYENLLQIIADPKHPEHLQTYRWLRSMKGIRGKFDPNRFDPKQVKFSDPAKRWSNAFGC